MPAPHSQRFRVLFYSALALSVVTAVVCGVIGHYDDYRNARDGMDLFEFVIRVAKLFKMEAGESKSFWLNAARLSAAVFWILAAGKAVAKFMEEWPKGDRVRKLFRHTVVCGLDGIGRQLIACYANSKLKGDWLAVEADDKSPWLGFASDRNVQVIVGDASHGETLDAAQVEKASCLFAVTRDDAANLAVAAESAKRMQGVRDPQARRPRIYLHQIDSNLATNDAAFRLYRNSGAELVVFSALRNAATQLLASPKFLEHAPSKPDEVAHYFLIGFGPEGRQCALQLALLGHFPNRKRARFTIADEGIDAAARDFLSDYGRFTAWNEHVLGVSKFSPETDDWRGRDANLSPPFITPASECSHAVDYAANAMFVELPPNVGDARFIARIEEAAATPGVKPVVFVCTSRASENFRLTSRVRQRLNEVGQAKIPVFVWMSEDSALEDSTAAIEGVTTFGDLQSAADLETLAQPQRDYFARTFHEAYEAGRRRRAEKDKQPFEAQLWDSLPAVFVESNRQAAEHLPIKLWMLGFLLRYASQQIRVPGLPFPHLGAKTGEILADMEHNRWLAERLLSGWQYGAKDAARKRHHLLIPNEMLPQADRMIDQDLIRAALREAQKGGFYLEQFTETPRLKLV